VNLACGLVAGMRFENRASDKLEWMMPSGDGEVPQRVLMLCVKYSFDKANPSLMDELARSLSALGCAVRVLVVDWSRRGPLVDSVFMDDEIRVRTSGAASLDWGPHVFRLMVKWLWSSARIAKRVSRECGEWNPDAVVAFSPATAMALPIMIGTRHKRPGLFILWDFFPIHQAEIGLIKSRWMVPPLKLWNSS
jgi:hypothetical protein